VPELIEHGRYLRPTLGIKADDDISKRLLDGTGVKGVLVLQVERGSAADRAGLRGTRMTADGDVIAGDAILAVDGRSLSKVSELLDRLEQFNIGDRVKLTVYRNGISETISVVLGAATDGSRSTGTLDIPHAFPMHRTVLLALPRQEMPSLTRN
jgi:S1-C subfamily serine protease